MKTAVITGATGGIGIEICKYLLQNGYRILAAFRTPQKGEHLRKCLEALGEPTEERLFLFELDLLSFGSTDGFAAQIIAFLEKQETPLHLLINNAGMIAPRFQLTEDGYESSLEVNYLSPRRLTEQLLPYICPLGKIINTVSCTIRVARREFPGEQLIPNQERAFISLRNYSNAKLQLALYTIDLHRKATGIFVCGADPGIVDTGIITQHRWYDPLADLFFRPFIKRPAAGAIPILHAIEYREKAHFPEAPPLLFKGSRIQSFHKKILDMAHNHSHADPAHGNASKNITTAFILNSIFVVIELVGGILTNSIAILSDALHDFGDCISLGIAWGLQKKSLQKGDERYSYGYKRFSLLGSIFLSGILTVSSLFVITEAVKRVFAPQAVDAGGMFWLAILGIVVNGAAALKLKKGETLNEKAVFLHLMEDVLGWIAVLIVSIVMRFVEVPVLDPLLSIAISLWVLSNVYKNMRDAFRILLQRIPENINIGKIREQIEQIPGVDSVHDLHIWTQDGVSHVMTLHVVVLPEFPDTDPLREQIHTIGKEYGIVHITLEFERPGSECKYLSGCE